MVISARTSRPCRVVAIQPASSGVIRPQFSQINIAKDLLMAAERGRRERKEFLDWFGHREGFLFLGSFFFSLSLSSSFFHSIQESLKATQVFPACFQRPLRALFLSLLSPLVSPYLVGYSPLSS